MANHKQLPIPVKRALRKLGGDIRDARRRRRIPTQVMAERAGISRTTLLKVERGVPGVSFGTLATVLFVLERELARREPGDRIVLLGFGPGLTMEGLVATRGAAVGAPAMGELAREQKRQ